MINNRKKLINYKKLTDFLMSLYKYNTIYILIIINLKWYLFYIIEYFELIIILNK